MKKNEKIWKIEIIIFTIFLFLQNFAIITTENFGISALVVFLIYSFIKYKMIYKISKNLIITCIGLVIFLVISGCINGMLDIMQILRLCMIIFVGWSTIEYINVIQKQNQINFFYKVFYTAIVCVTIYGIYQIIASKYRLPMVLNILSNNTSYGIKPIFYLYGGWSNKPRIYATFFEPSVYSIFLIIAYFFIIDKADINKKQKIIITVLFLINLFFTYARSGWITFIYYIGIFFAFKIFNKKIFMNKLMKILIIMLPLLSLLVMSILGLIVFEDESAKARTYSSLYYLENTFDNLKSIFIGHGLGSISQIPEGTLYNNFPIERFAHNGYVDIMYQLGIIFLVLLICFSYNELKKKKLEDKWLIFAILYTLCCFGTMFNIESIISLVFIVIATEMNKKQENIEGEKYVDNHLSE